MQITIANSSSVEGDLQRTGNPQECETRDIHNALAAADGILRARQPFAERLTAAAEFLGQVDQTSLPTQTAEDLALVVDAMRRASGSDLQGVEDQYTRLVNSTVATCQSDRLFFSIWQRTGEPNVEPCILLCSVNQRNLGLLEMTRSRRFVNTVVARLGASSYPGAILRSRMQGVDVLASAGVRPNVLFADFVKMPANSRIDPATAGGLLFDKFGDAFLDQMPMVRKAFPNVAEWLENQNILNPSMIRFLTTAHVQAHDLCGHSVPYELRDSTRTKADWFLRSPLEELYADANAMWIYSAPETRALLRANLSEEEMTAVPLMIAMKRFTFYALLDREDFDARCSWMIFNYLRKAGIIRCSRERGHGFHFELEGFRQAIDQLLSDTLRIEHEIASGVAAYEAACRDFTLRYGWQNPLTQGWTMPDELQAALSI